MSVMRGELLSQQKPLTIERYVYVKMLQAQADAEEGKVPAGAVLTIAESKALRWVYRARIARPATQAEFLEYNKRNPRARGFVIPEKVEFNYVEPDSDEGRGLAQVATAQQDMSDNPRTVSAASGHDTLADKLEAITADADKAPPEPKATVGPEVREGRPVQGNYADAITRGPGPSKEERREERRNRS